MTGDRPAASGFTPAPTGFVFRSQTRPSTPTESSSLRRPIRGRLGYGLVVLVALLSTPDCSGAVTVRYRTVHHRTEADFHRPIPSPSQAHERDRLGRTRRRLADGFPSSSSSLDLIYVVGFGLSSIDWPLHKSVLPLVGCSKLNLALAGFSRSGVPRLGSADAHSAPAWIFHHFVRFSKL